MVIAYIVVAEYYDHHYVYKCSQSNTDRCRDLLDLVRLSGELTASAFWVAGVAPSEAKGATIIKPITSSALLVIEGENL